MNPNIFLTALGWPDNFSSSTNTEMYSVLNWNISGGNF